MSKPIPINELYWLADATGLVLHESHGHIHGRGKVYVPLVEALRLICPLSVVSSMYSPVHDEIALCLHVRQDLYLVIARLSDGGGIALAVDASKSEVEMTALFQKAPVFGTVVERLKTCVVGVWRCGLGDGWSRVRVDSVGRDFDEILP